MNSYIDYTPEDKLQLLLQKQYNSLDKPSNRSNISIDITTNNLNPTSIMQFNDLNKSKRRQVKNACVNCQKACKKCDDGRPCQRCIKYNLTETCQDSVRKERKKGIKRGPYKRINSQANQDKADTQKMLKSQDVNRNNSVTDNVESLEIVYPQKPSVLPKHNECNQTNKSVTPPSPPPPVAICSSQNNLSSILAVSSPYHFNQPNPIVYNSSNTDIIHNYQYAKMNSSVNIMTSPTNHSLIMASNSSSPQQQSVPVSLENNFLDIFTFYNSNNIQQNNQNNSIVYHTPINSPARYSAENSARGSELMIDSPHFNRSEFYS